VDTTKAITHLSLCSGYEGIGLGLRSVLPTLREIAYVEREGFPVANLVAKMEAGELDAAPVFTDVKTFPYGKFRGIVDILSGGFPCQPFSAAGKRQATEDPRHLFPYIADGIRECQPRIVFLENVQGILSCKTADGEPVLQYVLRELEGMGYRATAGIFSAEEVGAPHQRKRVFILGMANSNRGRGEIQDQGQLTGEQVFECNGSSWGAWPSGPGEAQQEWEEPRVVGDTESIDRKPSGLSEREGEENPRLGVECENQDGISTAKDCESEGSAEPKLGRASNGSSIRVDRLRLLGNGVVPQTAAKAFITLINRLI
jgi:DNA (cytosine-5)-methyltransferase 1